MKNSICSLALLLSACAGGSSASPSDAIAVGVLLPYSGANAASGANIEQAMILATDWVNSQGGVAGRPLELIIKDSLSDATLGLASATDLIDTQQLKYIIGPQEDDLAFSMANLVIAANAVNLLPAVESPSIYNPQGNGIWYNLTTPAQYLACGLALYLDTLHVTEVDIVTTTGSYDSELANRMTSYIEQDSIELGATVTLERGGVTYSDQLSTLGSDTVILLLTDPFTGATVVQDLLTTRKSLNLAMGPSLKTPYFLQNVPASLLAGQIGAGPSLLGTASTTAFTSEFAARWGQAPPSRDAFSYFDAVILLALALNHALGTDGAFPDSTTFDQHMAAATDTTLSASSTWLDFAAMAKTLQAGGHVRYSGVTGPFAFDSFHNALPAPIEIWAVDGDGFESNIALAYCNETPNTL